MTHTSKFTDQIFSSFGKSIGGYPIPERFTFPFSYEPHPLSLLAVEQLQSYLNTQQDWEHNFGLSNSDEAIIGKMFGVLVVKDENGEIGYLSAFSGKIAGRNNLEGFVPPIFDGVAEGGFLNIGMLELSQINVEIKKLELLSSSKFVKEIYDLKVHRRSHSVSLQNQIFDQYNFLNRNGETLSLRKIFENASYKNPPAGAGECAAPKLLQYAFQNKMTPLAMAEFWWGKSPKSAHWQHGKFYPACREKCEPILGHMLSGIELEERQANLPNLFPFGFLRKTDGSD
ncbi:pseudouridylate synthase [Dyadobacter sp. CY345]|uniref:pseudouridylate synthase n=1 Tax=Dyadobacter sp. CY345 TaxID=2909335 RepID=UPI001F360ADE|nr:pseudouridylate synthase [Dyadobacter sp. CY345]MCF2446570.1 pseudouridylate synthase [Dyadobacter sp. CY345]